MPMQYHELRSPCDLDSRKIKAVRSDALELIIDDIRQALEQAIVEGVDLDHFEWRLRRKMKTKKGKLKHAEYTSCWTSAEWLVDSFYLPGSDAAEWPEAVISNG